MSSILASYATMIASISVFVFEGIAYNVIYLGRILPALDKQALVVPFFVMFNFAWSMAVWSYVQAHRCDPGVVPEAWHDFVGSVGSALVVVPARLEWQPGKATLCRKCGVPRPERAHHCHVCNVCVLRMDHHCPWIRNCVGFRNHKFFLLLVMYSTLAAFLGLLTSVTDLVTCNRMLMFDQDISQHHLRVQLSDMIVFFVFGLLALFFLALLTPMVTTHFPLACQNVTSIESHYDSAIDTNPFDQEGSFGNIRQIFGCFGPDWIFPVQPLRPLSDGVTFQRGAGSDSGDSGSEDEEAASARGAGLWRMRYSVRQPQSRPDSVDSDFSPLAKLASWWKAEHGHGRHAEFRL